METRMPKVTPLDHAAWKVAAAEIQKLLDFIYHRVLRPSEVQRIVTALRALLTGVLATDEIDLVLTTIGVQ